MTPRPVMYSSRPGFGLETYVLGLEGPELGLEGPDLGLESCTGNVLVPPSNARKIIKLIIVNIAN